MATQYPDKIGELLLKNLSHELALKATEEHFSPAEIADDILRFNDRCLLAQRSKVSFERSENKQINLNTKENGQIDAVDLYPLKHLSPGEKVRRNRRCFTFIVE
ncbi:hypothetical protein Smp_130550 [Schistosoma mansoni]|uniref:hypothetical protein n=1 Tax=Schistosoma mansoni TaxID=6183 RepID=UPI00022DBEAA|nr:hypothetical protein Smp_130550 [Schistosoma mansoni]|eukprot:XP_018653562.1 hypothetical protein Smp_130550 [Schistosoma mansoni]